MRLGSEAPGFLNVGKSVGAQHRFDRFHITCIEMTAQDKWRQIPY